MNPIAPSVIPPRTGLAKEEPEFALGDDIPSDDNRSPEANGLGEATGDVERE